MFFTNPILCGTVTLLVYIIISYFAIVFFILMVTDIYYLSCAMAFYVVSVYQLSESHETINQSIKQTTSNPFSGNTKAKSYPDPATAKKTSSWSCWRQQESGSKKSEIQSMDTFATEMSIRLDLGWTGSGLCHILLNLGWARTVNCLINLGSGPDLDWVNGKELRDICY